MKQRDIGSERRPSTVMLAVVACACAVGCSSAPTSPGEQVVSLDDLEEPSYYVSGDSLYTFSRSESLVVVHFVEGVSEAAQTAELADLDFEFVQRIGAGDSPRLTVAKSSSLGRHFPLLRASPSVDWATPVLLTHEGSPVYPFNRISVAFMNGVSVQDMEARIRAIDAQILENTREAQYDLEIPWSRADSVFTLARQLDADPLVLYATPGMYIRIIIWNQDASADAESLTSSHGDQVTERVTIVR